jgi:hypothetical protein
LRERFRETVITAQWRKTVLACCLAAGSAVAVAEDAALGLGLHYSQGDYGTGATTKIGAVVLTGRYERAPWTYKAMLPYLYVTGGRAVIPGVGPLQDTDVAGARKTEGVGDPVLSGTYAAYQHEGARFGVDLTARLKLAVGDTEEQLSTGENDLGLQVDAFKAFDRITVFAGVGYTIFGKTPLIPLQNVVNYTLGASLRLDERETTTLSYDEREPVTPTSGWQREVTLSWAYRLDRGWRAQSYFLLGLDDGSPDWGLGMSAVYVF